MRTLQICYLGPGHIQLPWPGPLLAKELIPSRFAVSYNSTPVLVSLMKNNFTPVLSFELISWCTPAPNLSGWQGLALFLSLFHRQKFSFFQMCV